MPDWKKIGGQFVGQFGAPWDWYDRIITQESGWQHRDASGRVKISSAGAIGFGQLMPRTAAGLGVDPYDETDNLKGAAKYLGQLWHHYNGDVVRSIAAYNAGPGTIDSWDGKPSDLPAETRKYLTAIVGPDWANGVIGGGDGTTTPEPDPGQTVSIDWLGGLREWWQAKKDAAEGSAVEVVAPWIGIMAGGSMLAVGLAALAFRSPPAKLVTKVAQNVPNPYVAGGARLAGTLQ